MLTRRRKPSKKRIFEETLTNKPKMARPTAYRRRRRVVLPIPGLAINEGATVNEVEHESPISYTVDTPIDWTCYKDYHSVDTTANLNNTISKFVMSVLSEDQNSTLNQTHPQDLPTRTFMRRPTNLNKGPMDTNNVTSDSMAKKSEDATSDNFVAENADGLASMNSKNVTSDSIAKKGKNVSSDDFVTENTCGLAQIKENYPIIENPSHAPSLCQLSGEPRANPPSETACIISPDDHLNTREPSSRENMVERRVDKPIQSNCSRIRTLSFSMSEMVNLIDDDDDDDAACSSRSKFPLVTVQGYSVKKELAQVLQLILNKHGDIAANCPFQHKKSRSSFLEQTCEIIEELKELEFVKVSMKQLESMRALVKDLELVIDVSWLEKRLDDIMGAKLIIKQSSAMEEERIKNTQEIEGIERENEALKGKLKENEEKLDALKEESMTIDRRCCEAKQKVQCFYKRSLVNDLL